LVERRHASLVGVALIVGLSPSLLVAAGQLADEPRLFYVPALLVLLGHLAATAPRDPDARLSSALPWVFAAIVIQILTTAGGFPHFSRFAVPFGMVAFLRVCGTPLRVSLFSFLCVPPPHLITNYFGVPYASLWVDLLAAIVPRYVGELVAWDAGLRFMAVGTAVAAYRSLRASLPWRGMLTALGAALALAIPLQILTLALAGFFSREVSEVILIHGGYLLVLMTFLLIPLPGLRPSGMFRSGRPRAL
jgi:hypothetical protein